MDRGEPSITRGQADLMAVRFLASVGPHTMGPIESDEEFAAMMIFLDLEKEGIVHRTILTHGYLQFTLTDKGRLITQLRDPTEEELTRARRRMGRRQ